jgi:[acyl-carrier-protein] S-malonyltransferase
VATWRYWQRQGGQPPTAVAGHSLGEFTALAVAGALDFPAAVRLVRTRGQLMQEAVPAGVGAIAAVLGLEDGQVALACHEAAHGEIVESVNFNSSGQVVIAGHAGAVQRALEGCNMRGARRTVMLPMSVPAHSSLMEPAARRFADHMAEADLRAPAFDFWSPVDSRRHCDPEDIRQLLVRQLTSPVHWKELIRVLAEAGTRMFVECGPGKVLTGLNKRAERRRDLVCIALEDAAAVSEALIQQTDNDEKGSAS